MNEVAISSSEQEKQAQVALRLTPGVGDVLLRHLVSACGSARAVFKQPAGKLDRIRGIGTGLAQQISQKNTFSEAEQLVRRAEAEGVQILFYNEPTYPDRLKRLYDAPPLLFYLGKADLNAPRTLALVGTRQATDYGRRVTEDLVESLVHYQVLLVSGLAFGIDITAHRACLKTGIPTVGVMASGLDTIYPVAHTKTARHMLETGGLLTEQPFGVQPDPRFFAARNRIIAGLADAVIVVESARKGGGLITAEYANNYHRDVLAVPGDLRRLQSEGCNELIRRNKATIYTDVQNLAELLGWDENGSAGRPSNAELDLTQFTDLESQILSLLRQGGEVHIDALAWQAQVPMNQLASLLLNLEFGGFIRSLPGKRYALG